MSGSISNNPTVRADFENKFGKALLSLPLKESSYSEEGLAMFRALTKRILQGNLESFCCSHHVSLMNDGELPSTKFDITLKAPSKKTFSGWQLYKGAKKIKSKKMETITVNFPKKFTIKVSEKLVEFEPLPKDLPMKEKKDSRFSFLYKDLYLTQAIFSKGPGEIGTTRSIYLGFFQVYKGRKRWDGFFKLAGLAPDVPAPKVGPGYLKNLTLTALSDYGIDCKNVPPVLMQPKVSKPAGPQG